MEETQEAANILRFVRVGGLPTALLAIAAAFVLVRVTDAAVQRLGTRFAHRRLLLHQINSFIRFAIIMGGFATALGLVFRFTNEMMIAVGGTVAVTIGFALKDLAASVLAGMTVLVDKPFQVGDRVTFGGYYGEIKEIGLRSVKLVTLDDTLVTIPNNKFLTEVVASGNAGAVDMMVQMDFFVGLDQDLPRAKKVVEEALTSTRYISMRRPWAVLVNQVAFENWVGVRLRAKGYVLDVQYEKAFETDVTERVLDGFKASGIKSPSILHDAPRSATA